MFRYWEQEKAKYNHNDFNNTTEITENAKNIIYFSDIIDSFFVEINILSEYSLFELIVEDLDTLFATDSIKMSFL